MQCPPCKVGLRPCVAKQNPHVRFWACQLCGGRAIEGDRVRYFVPKPTSDELDELTRKGHKTVRTRCPRCATYMIPDSLELKGGAVEIDACASCHCLWFDRGELERITAGQLLIKRYPSEVRADPTPHPKENDEASIESIDERSPLMEIQAIAHLPALEGGIHFSLPTIALAWLIAAFSIFQFHQMENALDTHGFVPAQAFHSFLPWISSAFVHGGWLHLLSNLYFLVLAGSELECCFGTFDLLLIFFVSVIGGDLAQALFNSGSEIPSIGASGGIAGMLAAFVLRFPNRRVSFVLGTSYRWNYWMLYVPSWAVFFLFVLGQIAGHLGPADGIAYLDHLGGIAAGILVYFVYLRERRIASVTSPISR